MMLFETVTDAAFWTKVIVCCAAILISIPILIFVRRNERNFGRVLRKRFDALDKQIEKLLKKSSLSRRDLIELAGRLNAVYKISQQAAYEDDSFGFDRVKTLLGEACEDFADYGLFRRADPERMRERILHAKERITEAEEQLSRSMESENMIRNRR